MTSSPATAASSVGANAQRAGSSATFGALLAAGLVVYGCVHLLIAWIALRLAWWSGDGDDPVRDMARTAFGQVLLWLAAAGLAVLVLWRVLEASVGHHGDSTRKRVTARLGALAQAAAYAGIAVSAAEAAVTNGRKGSVQGQGRRDSSLGAELMRHWWGLAVVAAIGITLLVLGVRMIISGLSRSFLSDLRPPIGPGVTAAGVVGTAIKGVVLIVVGVLFGVAVVIHDPSKTGGLAAALHTLRGQWYGPALLTVIGVGLAAYGAYCFAWSRHAKH